MLDRMLADCYSLLTIPRLDTTGMSSMHNSFRGCSAMQALPPLVAPALALGRSASLLSL